MIRKAFAFTLLILLISVINSYSKGETSWIAFSGNGISSPAEIRIVDEFNGSMDVELSLNGINIEKRIQDNEEYQFISIPNSDWLKDVGKPKLPIVRSLFTIPNTSEISLEVEFEDRNVLSKYKVYPAGKPIVKNGRNNTVYIDEQFAIDKEFYKSNIVYPQETVKISFSGYLRDQKVVQLEFHPIKYNPSTKELFYSKLIRVRLNYKQGFTVSGLLKNLYDGSETFSLAPSRNNDIKATGNINYVNDLMQSIDTDYIIIAAEPFYNNTKIKQLAEWRSQYSGLDVAVVSYDKIYYTFGTGKSPDERIKAFMQHAYYYWKSKTSLDGRIRYVLIIGDVEFIPTHISDNVSFDENIATDNWYACLSGNDEMPDIMIGRFPVKNVNELSIMVDKTIQYEQNPLYSNWANNALLLLGTVDYLSYDLISARDEYLIPSGFNVTEISGLSGGNSNSVISELNKGQYILDYAGHGFVDGWEILGSQDIQKLKNDRMLPAIFSLACSTAYFDHPDKDSFAEVFVKAKNGAIAFFGGSRLVSPSVVGFALSRAVAGSHLYTLGEIIMWTKLQLLSYQNDLELYNLLGDPALDLGAPRRFPNMPDIVVTPIDISVKPEMPKQGENITIKATINNFGAIDAQNVEVEFRDGGPEGLLITKKVISKINSLGSINTEVNWEVPLGIPLHDIYIKAYLNGGNSEYWTKNNYTRKQISVSLESPGFPIKISDRSLSPTVAGDIDGDNEMEILFQSYSYDRYTRIYAFHKDGQPVNGWQKTITNPKFSYEVQYINSSAGPVPSIGDIDGDGKAEVVAVFYSQLIHAWKGNGSYVDVFPVQLSGYATTTPVLADMDKDGKLDIVVGVTSGQVYVIKYDGTILTGFPVNTGKKAHLFVAVNDLDNDGDLEIIAVDSIIPRNYDPSGKSTIYAWHHNGEVVNGFPVQMQGAASILPLVTGDLDGDGKAEIIAVASNNTISRLYIWNADGSLKNICYIETDDQIRSAISLADIDDDGDIEIIAGSYYGIIYAWHHDSRNVYGFPVKTDDGYNLSTPIIGDIDGDEKLEIIATAQNGSISAYRSDGTSVQGWQNVIYENLSLSPPMITDLDGDMKAELVYNSDYGLLHNLSLIGKFNSDNQFGWYMFQRDQRHTGSYSAKGILPPSPLEIQAVDNP
ncbi:MAG: C25 family cysteine peptidase, partial [Candidatus Poribacteria bacterium]